VPEYPGRVLDGDGEPVGTCFQVAPGVLVTAWHVLDDIGAAEADAAVQVDPLAGGEAFGAAVQRLDLVHDLAVLTCAGGGLAVAAEPLTATDQLPLRVEVRVTGHAVPGCAG
jgi:Trypsin-like peptidase domain